MCACMPVRASWVDIRISVANYLRYVTLLATGQFLKSDAVLFLSMIFFKRQIIKNMQIF
jgi:hypothetical protein